MTALQIFRMVAPEFKSIPDNDTTDASGNVTYGVNSYISLFSSQISESFFGERYAEAQAYLTAHKLKMLGNGDDDGLGSISSSLRANSYSEGETSVSFASASELSSDNNDEAEYKLTVYGIEFLTIKHSVIIPIICSGQKEAESYI